jgi:hypothetical protein
MMMGDANARNDDDDEDADAYDGWMMKLKLV